MNYAQRKIVGNTFAGIAVVAFLVGLLVSLIPIAWGVTWIVVTVWRIFPPL